MPSILFTRLLSLSATMLLCLILLSCSIEETAFQKDLAFLQQYDSVIILSKGESKVVVSARYQARVFTSTPGDGASYGWINYPVFDAAPDPHMNAYGGENRIWLGPEGGPFSLFFPGGFIMDFANWRIPPAFDTEPWELIQHNDTIAVMEKDIDLVNYAGTELSINASRKIKILGRSEITKMLGINYDKDVSVVAYLTDNAIVNTGRQAWTDSTGMPCIWILDMFPPSGQTTIVIPYTNRGRGSPVNTSYFGEISRDRIRYDQGVVFFKGDGQRRSKLGILPASAKNLAGSYDPGRKKLTIVVFDLDPAARYLNQEWNTREPAFSGDAVYAYNDGPLEDGRILGPFYELESVSPAAFLQPGETLNHRHSVFHFSGDESGLDSISRKTLGVSLEQIRNAFR